MNDMHAELHLCDAVAGKTGWTVMGTAARYRGRVTATINYRAGVRRWSLKLGTLSGGIAKREFVSSDVASLVTFAMEQQPGYTACDECDECARCRQPNYGAWRQGSCTCREDSTCVIYRNILESVSDDRRWSM